jgi:glycogen synthase
MHVVFVLPRFFPYRGGYESSLLALSKHLVTRGHRVTVFTTVADDLEAFWRPGHRTFPAEQLTVDGVTIRRFPICYNILRRRATRLLGLAPNWRCKARFWRPSFRTPGLDKALRHVDADLFHIGPLPYTNLMYSGLRAAERKAVPVVATPCTHMGEEGSDEVARQYVQSYQIELLNRCARVFCMTQYEKERLEEFGVTSEKVVVGYGIDVKLATGGSSDYLRRKCGVDGPVVLHLGMKAYDKGSVTLVEAMKILWAQGSNAWLVMAGPSLSAFDEYLSAKAQGCQKLLNLPPFADEERRELLASASMVVQPSRVESLGLVLLEAWANAKSVIAADIAVSRQLVTSCAGGVVVPFGDSARLAAEIRNMLDHPDRAQAMGRSGQQNAVSEYEGDRVWLRNAEQFEQVVSASRDSQPGRA